MISNDELISAMRVSMGRASMLSGPFISAVLIVICMGMAIIYALGYDTVDKIPRHKVYKAAISVMLAAVAVMFIHDTFLLRANKPSTNIPVAVSENISYSSLMQRDSSSRDALGNAERIRNMGANLPTLPTAPTMAPMPTQLTSVVAPMPTQLTSVAPQTIAPPSISGGLLPIGVGAGEFGGGNIAATYGGGAFTYP